ncbi:MAG: NAD+ synthase [Candidatus Gastranaerophilales bacterium]|nr:NAD+ synthase [Candidatus Gastranaerophilales bacterium]
MKIALAQINTKVGDLDNNIELIKLYIGKAIEKNADIVVFPELCVTGYPPKDLLDFNCFIDDNLTKIEELKKYTDKIAVICGFVDKNVDKFGKKYFNSAVLIYKGKIISKYNKCLLPTYDVFDETRYFEDGKITEVIDFKGKKIGLTICEDIWNDKDYFDKPLYEYNPIEKLYEQQAEVIINISASPYNIGKEIARKEMICNIAKKYSIPVVYVNQVGANDDLVFDGNSIAVDKNGSIITQNKDFEEDLTIFDLEKNTGEINEISTHEEETLLKALKLGIKDYCSKLKFKKVLIGLSGGIDSALTAAIACQALGSENVVGITMPSKYSSKGSIDDSIALAENLGMECKIIPIKNIFDSFKENLDTKEEVVTGIAEENLQARIRGNILMTYSNRYGYLLLSTGNKSEISVGYCTLYGDMAGGFNFLSDVPKTMVYSLSRFINKDKEIIPYSTIEKEPSAELRPNQADRDTLPPYEALDSILKAYIEEYKCPDEIAVKHPKELVLDLIRKINNNEYKRKQATLGLKVTTRAFGSGRRFPIVQGYKFH